MKLKFNFKFMLASVWMAGCAAPPPLQPPPDGGDAQRVVALVDYVRGDYAGAVRGGQVLVPSEYEEQLRFVSEARALTGRLLGGSAAPGEAVLDRLGEVEARVKSKADPKEVEAACVAAREALVARFGLRTTPTARPNLARAEAAYTRSCAVCHGAQGDALTERAQALDPHPVSFLNKDRLGQLSPYRVYNALTFGVPATAMASFESLSPEERWDLAFYVFRLGHAGEASRPAALPLAEMAIRSDRDILAALRQESDPQPPASLAYLRTEAPFKEGPAAATVERTRRLLGQAAAAYARGERRGADRRVLDAYLQGFEPLEPRLRARDSAGTQAVETGFRDLRSSMAAGAKTAVVDAQKNALDDLLVRVAEGQERPLVPLVAAAVIFFREGVEAALLVGALLAGLRRLGRGDAARYVHAGWALALPSGLLTFWAFDRLISLGNDQRELMEGLIAIVAAAVLFSMSFWMISRVESRHWIAYLKKNLEETLSRRNLFLLAGLAFLAVYREAAETVLFTQALLLESGQRRGEVLEGAALGLGAVLVAAVVANRTVLRLPLGTFFAVSSLLLCGLAISFAGSGIYILVAAGYLSPRPVPFPEVGWMGIHPDLTSLLVQVTILTILAGAGLTTLRRRPAAEPRRRRS